MPLPVSAHWGAVPKKKEPFYGVAGLVITRVPSPLLTFDYPAVA
ncbi:hypothetical protein AB0M48_01585 [Lentzea sp. NPDC051208]